MQNLVLFGRLAARMQHLLDACNTWEELKKTIDVCRRTNDNNLQGEAHVAMLSLEVQLNKEAIFRIGNIHGVAESVKEIFENISTHAE